MTESDWTRLLQRPEPAADGVACEAWFNRIAARLLHGCRLMVNGQPHRLVEVEFYYHGDGHLDPFTHRDPLQRACGRWYFHRTRGTYRGGSFKGLDLTFGAGEANGGVLLRGLETPDGRLVDGPSLLVDHLLAATSNPGVAALDETIATRQVWSTTSPLHLISVDSATKPSLYRSARVGLSLKKAAAEDDMPHYILRPYRYLSEPRRTAKGKLLLVLALHVQGLDPAAIQQLTGCPRASIQRYLTDYETGRQLADFAGYRGCDLSPADLCRLHGTWHARFGSNAAIV
ncbi:MAG: hypothetical protein JNM56_38240 [Planctomycetia bacterium]|nr:hypothetical protein [Planctomycetia bacterium]